MISVVDRAVPVVESQPVSVAVYDSIRSSVQLALYRAHPQRRFCERRRQPRHPYPHPIYLTPVDARGEAKEEETIVVIGRHLAECGLDFYYSEPVTHRRVIASLDLGEDRWAHLLLQLTWCRFRHGWYENGGRFVNVASSPSD